jgi:GT2 family glycosyltransferase
LACGEKMMDYSVGIITYNRAECIQRLLLSLDDLIIKPKEVIIVDDSENNRTKNIVNSLKQVKFKINYIKRDGKGIQGGARNKIIEEFSTDILCFLDDDTEVKEGWGNAIVSCYQEEDVMSVGGPAITVDESSEPVVDFVNETSNKNYFNRFGETQDRSDCWIPPNPVETDRFMGANMSFRREVFEKHGGFSEGYKGNGFREEDSLMVKVWKNGEKSIYHPEAKVLHYNNPSGGSRQENEKIDNYWKGKNIVKFLQDNFPYIYPFTLIKWIFYSKDSSVTYFLRAAGYAAKNKKPSVLYKHLGMYDQILGKTREIN